MKVVRNCMLLAITVIAAVGGVTPATAATAAAPVGTITESRVSSNGLNRVTLGPDGNLWFTEYSYEVRSMPGVQHGGNKIGRITTSGQITEFPVTTPFARADGITRGPDGAVYFTESPGNNAYGGIGRAQAVGSASS